MKESVKKDSAKEIFEKLREPFPEKDIEWRVGRAGITHQRPWAMVLAYVTARAVQDRLDEVLGPENWIVSYRQVTGGFFAEIRLKINDAWVSKEDGSDASDIEPFKGGISGALKRAASAWGIGRYLYHLEENFAEFTEQKSGYRVEIQGLWYNWLPPRLPSWALPKNQNQGRPETGAESPKGITPPLIPIPTPKVSPINERLGLGKKSERDLLYAKIMKLYPDFVVSLPVSMKEFLIEKYGVGESGKLTLEQLRELCEVMTNATQPKATKTSPSLPAHPLDNYVIQVGDKYPGLKFKDIDRKELEDYARFIHGSFLKEKKAIPKKWQDFFSKAEEYLFGAKPVESGDQDSVL